MSNIQNDNHVVNSLMQLGLHLTAPWLGAAKLCSPYSKQEDIVSTDKRWFASKREANRKHYIRQASFNEFDNHPEFHLPTLLTTPLLWVWIICIDADHILRIPIWRGNCPFNSEPNTDSAVVAIVVRCFENGGIDIPTVQSKLEKRL